MRVARGRRIVTSTVSATLLLFVSAGPAYGFIISPSPWHVHAKAATQGWAWQVQRSQIPSLAAVSGIPSGDIAVAWLGQADKLAYLDFGAEPLRGARLELIVDPDAPNEGLETATIRTCVIVSQWQSAEPMAWDTKPVTACHDGGKGSYDERAQAFRFNLTALAAALSSGGVHGVSIEPAEQQSAPFQVVFRGVGAGGVRLQTASTSPTSVSESTPDVRGAARRTAAGRGSEALHTVSMSAPDEEFVSATARPTPGPKPPTGRPFGMGGVYAAVAALAALPLIGRALASGLSRAREER